VNANARSQRRRNAKRRRTPICFRREIGAVAPLAVPPRASLPRNPPPPLPVQTKLDEEAVLHEAISDEFDPEILLETDETLSYCRPGVSQEVVRKTAAWRLDRAGTNRSARHAPRGSARGAGRIHS